MPNLSPVAQALPRSGIREIFDLARTIPGSIHLEVGEPDFPTPGHIVEAAVDAGRSGFTRYTPNAGILELRERLVEKLELQNDVQVSVDQVVVTNGAVEGLFATFLAILRPGDEVLLPDPGWPNFKMMVEALHGVVVPYRLGPENSYTPAAADLEPLITDRTIAILINSPSNPLGTVIASKDVLDIVELAGSKDLWVISDECYESILFDTEFKSAAGLGPDHVVSVFSFSKSYAMTGWRVGYVVGPSPIISVVTKLQEAIISCVNAPAQMAALAALTGPQDIVETMRASYQSRRDKTLQLFESRGIPVVRPEGAFYMWVDVSASGLDSHAFALALIKNKEVAVAPGTAFGYEGGDAVRVSLATAEDQLLEGAARIADMIKGG